MFVVAEQVRVNLIIDGIDAIEDIQNLVNIEVVEVSGGELPTMDFEFRTRSEELVRRMNERSEVQLGLGDDSRDMASAGFTIQHHQIRRSGDNFWLVKAGAIKSSLAKWREPRVEISAEMSGLERILQVARRADVVQSNVDKSGDRQRWIQYGCTNSMHVDDIWMHCDLAGSFPMIASTLDSFRIYDARRKFSQAAEGPDWLLSPLEADIAQGSVPYDLNAGIEHLSGMFNSFGARGKDMNEYELDTGMSSDLSSSPESLLALLRMPDVADASVFPKVSARRRPRSRNVHEKYWESMLHNHTQLGLYSSSKLGVSWRNRYDPIHPLDVVMFKDRDIREDETNSVESYSGLYVVSRVARSFDSSTFNTSVRLSREALNQ